MTRFDMPGLMRDFLSAAVDYRTLDVADVWALACNHGNNWSAMRDEVMQDVFGNRHSERGQAAHGELCKLNDKCTADEVRHG